MAPLGEHESNEAQPVANATAHETTPTRAMAHCRPCTDGVAADASICIECEIKTIIPVHHHDQMVDEALFDVANVHD